MDIIPVARFVFSIFIFGLMYYMFDGVLTTVTNLFGTVDQYGAFLLLMWLGLPLINLFVQGILLLMEVQRR
jgi:hypothetical protein